MDAESDPQGDTLTTEAIRAATDDIAALVDARVPESFGQGEPVWKLVLTAMVVRGASLAEAMAEFAVPERQSEALLMLRTLYEQTVTFLWLGIDPETRVTEWNEHTRSWAQALEKDAQEFGQAPTMDDDELAEKLKRAPQLKPRAQEVDEYWPARVSGFHVHPEEGPKNFRTLEGMYVLIYRLGSRQAHGTVDALGSFIREVDAGFVVERQRPAPNLEWSGLAIAMMGMMLLIAHELLGWPDEMVVRDIVVGLGTEPSEE